MNKPFFYRVLHQLFVVALLAALLFGLGVTRPAVATRTTPDAATNVVTWRGGGGDSRWSNPANWEVGIVPGATSRVRFPAGATTDALVDPAFAGNIASLVVEDGYAGTITLARDLSVSGDMMIADGAFVGGSAALTVTGKATVRGGTLTTPSNTMRVTALDIQSPGIVRMGANGKLALTGSGTPLNGNSLLDTTSNAPNSVEYTGAATTDLTAAIPAMAYPALGPSGGGAAKRQHQPPATTNDTLPRVPATFTETSSLVLTQGENDLQSAVIDPVNGFAYFGTLTYPGIVVKVRLADFTRVGALTLNAGENLLLSAVIDMANGFAYFGTATAPGIIVKVRLSDFTRVGALTLNAGENELYPAVIDSANGFAYFGTGTTPGIVVKVDLANLSFMKSANAFSASAGDTLTYTLAVTNDGPMTATGLTLTDTLPVSTTFVSVTPGAPTCNFSSGRVACTLGSLPAGASSQVNIRVTINTTATTPLINTATVTANEPRFNSPNNTVTNIVIANPLQTYFPLWFR